MTTAPSTPRPPNLERRQLSGRGYLVWIAIPFVIAAIGFTILHFNYDPEDVVKGERVPILTSSYITGQPNAGQLITGELTLDDQDCMRLVGADGAEITPVWPADYEAAVDKGVLSLYDPERVVVARGGDTVQMSGEFQDSSRFAANPCDPETGQVAVVQSQIAITGR